MHHSACSSSVATPPRPRIATCSYLLQRSSFCLGAAVRGRSYCRHHLHIRISLRRMARSRRATRGIASVSFTNAAAIRQTEIRLRVALAAGRIDPASGRMIFWALRMAQDLDRTLEPCKKRGSLPSSYQIQSSKSNRINQVPLSYLSLMDLSRKRFVSELKTLTSEGGRG